MTARQCALASGNTIKLIDLPTRRNLATIIGHAGEVIAVNFSADGKLLATVSIDSTIKIWDVSVAAITGRVDLARTLSGIAIPVESAAFGGDGRTIAVSGATAVSVWELNTGAALRTITRPPVALNKDNLNNTRTQRLQRGRAVNRGPERRKRDQVVGDAHRA